MNKGIAGFFIGVLMVAFFIGVGYLVWYIAPAAQASFNSVWTVIPWWAKILCLVGGVFGAVFTTIDPVRRGAL